MNFSLMRSTLKLWLPLQGPSRQTHKMSSISYRDQQLIKPSRNSKVLQEGKQLESDSTEKFDKWLKKCEEKMSSLKDVENRAKKLKTDGNEKFKQKNYEKAVEHYNEAVKLEIPAEAKSLIFGNMANALHKLRDHSGCLQAATMATELNPTWKKGHYWKGMSLFYLKEPEDSIKAFQTGLHIDPTDEDFQFKISAIQYCQEHHVQLEAFSSEDQLNIYQSLQRNLNFIKTDSFARDIMRLSIKGKDKIRGTQPTIIDHLGVLMLTEVPVNALTERDLQIQRKLKSEDMHKVYVSGVVNTDTGSQSLVFQDTSNLKPIQSVVLRLTVEEANKAPFNEYLPNYT
ncbi:stress-induced-phosphoprotein 1-like isoform X2 [Ptychodera flava]|uniref:stress-induced-phosphoprotein 1-like isoform X2 n=1 Tax=Ptychodera flava TaxID=63121 RepID=UPI00396A8C0A